MAERTSTFLNVFTDEASSIFFLYSAAACGRRSCVEWLLGNISSVGNERNKLGSSPLHVAAQNGHLEVVKLLVRA